MIQKALEYCKEKHKNQKRKYTGEPYYVHPIEVMTIVKSVDHNESMLIAALLHDTVEDTDATLGEISLLFGQEVAS